MTPPQITFATNQGDIGGGEVMLLNLATAARDLGVEVEVVGPRNSEMVEIAQEAGLVVHGLGETRRAYLLALRRWPGRGELLWANGLAPAFATGGQDGRVVHLHQQPRGKQTLAARAARLGAMVTLVPSHSMSRDVDDSRVLENWTADIATTTQPPAHDAPIIGFIGRPSVEKGLVVLADAIELMSRRTARPPRLLLAGEPRFVTVSEQRQVDAALGRIEDVTDRAGWVEPRTFFDQIDLAVFPSVVPESFGLVVAEAMSARVPFVISDAGALPEVAGSTHPWVAPTGDAAALADVIESAFESPREETAHVVSAARERWEAHFSPDAGRARLARLLGDLGVL